MARVGSEARQSHHCTPLNSKGSTHSPPAAFFLCKEGEECDRARVWGSPPSHISLTHGTLVLPLPQCVIPKEALLVPHIRHPHAHTHTRTHARARSHTPAHPHLVMFFTRGAHCCHSPSSVRQKEAALALAFGLLRTQSQAGLPRWMKGAAQLLPAAAQARTAPCSAARSVRDGGVQAWHGLSCCVHQVAAAGKGRRVISAYSTADGHQQ